jgi:DNA adenine methylase
MNPLLKWPGGKSTEIHHFEKFIPKFQRYIEPFFGGGALFFHLQPQQAAINDISQLLIDFYKLIQKQDKILYNLLLCYNNSFSNLMYICQNNYTAILNIYNKLAKELITSIELEIQLSSLLSSLSEKIYSAFSEKIILDNGLFEKTICKMVADKMKRTIKNNRNVPFSQEDLKNNLLTGFASGYYMYFRDIYNDINLNRIKSPLLQYKISNFYFIREYCYGSMFRYNKKGEFNIPYGGLSYNTKNFKKKIETMFNNDIKNIFQNVNINCMDFEIFLSSSNLTNKDFIFLDPPYDSEFSDYEGSAFTKLDQERLAYLLYKTITPFILVIKNTDFIYSLYEKKFNILSFDNRYTYNVRSRNKRDVKHLLITNLPV